MQKLYGCSAHYRITGNGKALEQFREEIKRIWHQWLDLRTRRLGGMHWKRFDKLFKRYYPSADARAAVTHMPEPGSQPIATNQPALVEQFRVTWRAHNLPPKIAATGCYVAYLEAVNTGSEPWLVERNTELVVQVNAQVQSHTPLPGVAPQTLAQSTQDQLVGTWILVSVYIEAPDGSRLDPFGAHPTGTLIMDGIGHISVQIIDSGLPNFASNDRLEGTPTGGPGFTGHTDWKRAK